MSWLRRLAAADAVPVFPVIGRNRLQLTEDLALDPRIFLVRSPRQAAVLLVVGELEKPNHPALCRLHDQLPHPRATVWWQVEAAPQFANPIHAGSYDDPLEAVVAAHGAMLDGTRRSEDDLLPDEPPAPWRGMGDHGQGGEGMMGGKPYGRPMAMTDADLRDGLALDAYTATFGPFLPMFPPGLALDVTLQGDVIQTAAVRQAPFEQAGSGDAGEALRNLARMLRLLDLDALSERVFRAARAADAGEVVNISALRRAVWSGALRAIPPGLGKIGGEDVRSRVSTWFDQALTAESSAAPLSTEPASALKTTRLVDLLPGLEWHEAVLVISSFGCGRLRDMCPVDVGEGNEQPDEDKDE